MITFLTSLLGIAGKGILSHFESKQKIAEAKTNAEIQRIATQQQADMQWDDRMAEGSMSSWKDEWWTILLSIPLIMCFIPVLAPYAKTGFETLSTSVPEWYLYAVSVSVAAAFGVKNIIGAIKK